MTADKDKSALDGARKATQKAVGEIGEDLKAGAAELRARMSAAAARARARFAGNAADDAALSTRQPDARQPDAEKQNRQKPQPAAKKPPRRPPAPTGPRRHPAAFGGWAEIALTAVSLGAVGLAAALYAAFVVIAPDGPEGEDLWAVNRLPSIVILDRNGEEIAARGARYGEAVSVEELPDYLIKAFLSTEDRRFYDHRGIDLRGMLRAALTNIKSGAVVEGGSTITQQLAKNLFLSPEQTYIRKAREAMLAIWLEGRFTKDEILSLYLNRIYMGAGAYGVESAAQTYFGKSARDVTLSEAVMLAGLPKAPSTLAPTQNPFGAQDRAFEVLDNLRETGAVTAFAAREARLNPPVIAGGDEDAELGYFFDYVAAKAREIAGPDAIDLIVTTTIDQDMQRAAQGAVKSVIGVDSSLAGAEQAALVAYDADGSLRAMVGGRSYVESQFNRATQAKRQPGSAFKPFVYVAAMEAGLTPQSRFVDQPVDIDGWKPENYGQQYQGPMRITEAVAKSVNTIAVQVTEQVGRARVAEAAKRLGVVSPVPANPSIALGASNMTLEELTAAYLPFARGGLSADPHAVLEVRDQAGEVYFMYDAPAPERLLSREVARDITHLLYQVMNGGTGARASLGARLAAGKTGTTNDWRDAWFIGYTAQITAGVWVGNDAYTPMDKITGGTLPAEIWKNFMIAAHQELPRVGLEGAYPAPTYADEGALISFYTDVLRGLNRVRRDGRERRFR